MEPTKNLCAQIPITLHEKVQEEKDSLGKTLSEYITGILKEHFEGGNIVMSELKTIAFQIPPELNERFKAYLTKHKKTQKQFFIEIINEVLEEDNQEN